MTTDDIACTLTETGMAERMDEWRQFAAAHVTGVDTAEPAVARLALAGTDAALLSAASLSQREKECCTFFRFAIEIDATQRWLVLHVPDEAGPVLDEFVRSLNLR